MISGTPSVNFQMVLLFYKSCRVGQISFHAPDRARKKMGAQNQSALLIETQLEKLLFDLYYLKERNCLRDKFSRILANFYKSTGSKFVKLNPRMFVAVVVVVLLLLLLLLLLLFLFTRSSKFYINISTLGFLSINAVHVKNIL